MSLKDKMKELKSSFGLAVSMGKESGARKFISRYDRYRKLSPLGFLALFLFAVSKSNWTLATAVVGMAHLHVFMNQIWWKLVNIEHRMDQKENHDAACVRNE